MSVRQWTTLEIDESELTIDDEIVEDVFDWMHEGLQSQERVSLFKNADMSAKLKYAKAGGSRKKYDGTTLMHLLLVYFPEFLEFNEPWVDLLISVERDVKNKF